MTRPDSLDRLYDDAVKDIWWVARGDMSPSEFLDHLSASVREVRADIAAVLDEAAFRG